MSEGFYLTEGHECVGPFASLDDANMFLELMTLYGESLEGIDIVMVQRTNANKQRSRALN